MNQELFCPNCENYRTTRRHRREETYTVRGQDITIPVESEYCNVCDARIGAKPTDQEIVDAVHAKYRRRHDLLTHPWSWVSPA